MKITSATAKSVIKHIGWAVVSLAFLIDQYNNFSDSYAKLRARASGVLFPCLFRQLFLIPKYLNKKSFSRIETDIQNKVGRWLAGNAITRPIAKMCSIVRA